jgi:hypothetical protein
MPDINEFAMQQAEAAAARLWAFGSAPFPLANGAIIQQHVEQAVTDTAIAFAIHARRLLDNFDMRTKFTLDEPFWHWSPTGGSTKVALLWDALNRIVHATDFTVGFEQLPDGAAKIEGGAISVLYLRTKTDQREESLIDVFALASCFFHQVLPALRPLGLTLRPSNPPSNNSMQRTALRAAADAGRWAGRPEDKTKESRS